MTTHTRAHQMVERILADGDLDEFSLDAESVISCGSRPIAHVEEWRYPSTITAENRFITAQMTMRANAAPILARLVKELLK